jgi:hypothetical protein
VTFLNRGVKRAADIRNVAKPPFDSNTPLIHIPDENSHASGPEKREFGLR